MVNPKGSWLEASLDALISDEKEEYRAVGVKCPSSQFGVYMMHAVIKPFWEIIDGEHSLKKKHVYYYQSQGVMAICQL